VIVKSVRLQLCLRAVNATFHTPVIHIYRDPRAILASVKRDNWGRWFQRLSLHQQLLEPSDGRAAYFGRWSDDIRDYDEGDPMTRAIAYWALTERFVEDSCSESEGAIAFLSYEGLCKSPEPALQRVLQEIGIASGRLSCQRALTAVDMDSPTTQASRRGMPAEQRVCSWRHELTTSEAESVSGIAEQFGLGHRLVCDS
jgi:hypothetical protein